MTAAGSEDHRRLIGAQNKINTDELIPEDLFLKLVTAMYQLSDCNVPLSEGIIVGRIIVENYWREKNADKSGG